MKYARSVKKSLWFLLFSGLVFLSPNLVLAEEQPVSTELLLFEAPMVSTASNKEEDIDKAPANIFVITDREMQSRGYRNLMDVFDDIPGVLNTIRVGDYTSTPIIRGQLRNTRFKFLINGMSLNIKSGKELEWAERFPINNVERVEFIVGPYASLYGRSSYSGVLNVITKSGKSLDGAKGVLLYGGTYNQVQKEIVYGKNFGDIDFLLSYFNNKSEQGRDLAAEYPELYSWEARDKVFRRDFTGWLDPPATADSVLGNPSLPKGWAWFWDHEDIYAQIKHEKGFCFDFHYNKDHSPLNIDLNPCWYYQDASIFSESQQTDTRLHHVHEMGKLTMESSLTFQYYDNRRMHGYITDVTKWFRARSKAYGVEEKIRYQLFSNNELMGGLAFENVQTYLDIVSARTANATLPEWTENDILTTHIYNGTLQDEWAVLDNLKLVGGIMYEHSNKYTDVVVPRFSAMWQVFQPTTIKLLYGGGYITPDPISTVDQIYGGGATKGNSNLKPETLTAYELNITHKFSREIRLAGAVYYNSIKDLVSTSSDPGIVPAGYTDMPINGGERKAYGGELSLQALIFEDLKIFANVNYVTGEVTGGPNSDPRDSFKRLPATAPLSAKVGLNLLLAEKKFNFYISDHYVNKWETYFGSSNPDLVDGKFAYYREIADYIDGDNVKGYNVVDITLGTTESMSKIWQVSLQVRNVFDQRAFIPPVGDAALISISDTLPRRNWNLQVSYKF